MALATDKSAQIHKVSIIPRGLGALGYTMQRPIEDRFLMTSLELEDKIAVLLGGRAAEKLVSIAPRSLTKAFFCNSGTEANENAMRIARMATGREKVITFDGGFHGRTADSISATFLGRYREIGRPNVPGHVAAKFGDLDSVRAVADSEPGTRPPTSMWWATVEAMAMAWPSKMTGEKSTMSGVCVQPK